MVSNVEPNFYFDNEHKFGGNLVIDINFVCISLKEKRFFSK